MRLKVKVREAKDSDKEPLMQFITQMWGGQDYIPSVWDKWMEDKNGRIFVAEVNGKAIGMNHIKLLRDGSGWLEGARIHPDFRGRGIANMLGEMAIRFAAERGVNIFRLTTRSTNEPAIRQVTKIGFEELSRYNIFELPSHVNFKRQRYVDILTSDDLGVVEQFIRNSEEYKLGGGLFWRNFTAEAITKEELFDLLSNKCVYTIKRRGIEALGIVITEDEGKERSIQVSFISGKVDSCLRLIKHVFSKRARDRPTRRIIFLPVRSKLNGIIRQIGLKRMVQMIVFQRIIKS